ncbi:uncharacterized protein DS421_11g333240 [Arachis hypogaea]|nr:uncharacterized protein DS421_11g333240 [Arachis hypogaea]
MGCCKPTILLLKTLQILKTLLMGNIMCKHCMNRSVLLVRSFLGISLFSCLLGRLDWHWPVAILLFSTAEQRPLSALYAAKLFHEVDIFSVNGTMLICWFGRYKEA